MAARIANDQLYAGHLKKINNKKSGKNSLHENTLLLGIGKNGKRKKRSSRRGAKAQRKEGNFGLKDN